MPKIRPSLESYVVRNTAELVDELSDERRGELAEVLHDLEGHSPRAEEAERRTEELVEKLENRNIVIAKSRARIEELERDLAAAKAEIGDREERIAAQLEAERVRMAEREQDFRTELESREAEIARRLEAFDVREQEARHANSELAERERSLSLREAGVENRARELQALERRSVEAAELERQVALRADAVSEREGKVAADAEVLEQRSARLAELEQQIEHRRDDLAASLARVQSPPPPRF